MAMHRVRKSTIHKRQVGVIPGGPDTAADEETSEFVVFFLGWQRRVQPLPAPSGTCSD